MKYVIWFLLPKNNNNEDDKNLNKEKQAFTFLPLSTWFYGFYILFVYRSNNKTWRNDDDHRSTFRIFVLLLGL